MTIDGNLDVSEDGQTAFATVAFDIEKVGVEELDAAEKAVQDVRDAGIQVEYDGGLGYAEVPAGGNSEMIGIHGPSARRERGRCLPSPLSSAPPWRSGWGSAGSAGAWVRALC